MKIRFLFLAILLASLSVYGQHDPGPRSGVPGAGQPIAGLTAAQLQFFEDGLTRFQSVEDVRATSTNGSVNNGLGPAFNSNQCSSCHSQPAIGGTSPSTNPEIAVASLAGADNSIPPFITFNGPAREARFVFTVDSNGEPTTTPDGGVHDLFTIQGRSDARGCIYPQPNFQQAIAEKNIVFRIPTPIFGAGLIEAISEATIEANASANSATKQQFGIRGHVNRTSATGPISGAANRSGNDGTITRFGWKAQNKSLLIFAGEAYNVEMGITNELFPNERGSAPPSTPPSSCLFNATPEDMTNLTATSEVSVVADTVAFANFMRMLDQPTPSCSGSSCSSSIQDGNVQFTRVGCALCHTPSMTTSVSYIAGINYVRANLFSDLLVHDMGSGLADGITQGGASGDEFRSAPLWGIGQRLFFLHDGRTSDLLQAIEDHSSNGSEANFVIQNFNRLSTQQKQDLLNFLRSL